MELYVHIPFCVRKCEYCDFLSAPADERLQNRYVGALCMKSDITDRQWDVRLFLLYIGAEHRLF